MKKGENKKGFTLIEVVLVLAVAGLIFLAVFIALPALQRQSRDTQRREDMFKLIAAIKKYQQNNRGNLPDDDKWKSELSKYLPTSFNDPSGAAYVLKKVACGNVGEGEKCSNSNIRDIESKQFPNQNRVFLVPGADCDGMPVVKSSNERKVAVVYKLEGGGAYCGTT